VNDTDICNPVITFTHKAGCPVANANALVSWVSENPWLIAIVLIAFGAVVTLKGSEFLPWVISITGGIVTFLVTLLFASLVGMLDYVDPTQTGGNVGLVILAVVLALAFGVLVGFLLKKFVLIGFTILGFVAGFMGGNLIYNFLLVGWIQSAVLYWILCIACGLAVGHLCHKK